MTKGKLLGQAVKVWSIIEYTEKQKKTHKKKRKIPDTLSTHHKMHVKYIQNPNQTIK